MVTVDPDTVSLDDNQRLVGVTLVFTLRVLEVCDASAADRPR